MTSIQFQVMRLGIFVPGISTLILLPSYVYGKFKALITDIDLVAVGVVVVVSVLLVVLFARPVVRSLNQRQVGGPV